MNRLGAPGEASHLTDDRDCSYIFAIWGTFQGSALPRFAIYLSDSFDDFEIEYDEITDADEADIKEFCQRLQSGLPLTSSEKLNAVHSRLRNFCRNLSRHSFFASKVAFADKRYAFFDVAAKVAAIEIEGIDAGVCDSTI